EQVAGPLLVSCAALAQPLVVGRRANPRLIGNLAQFTRAAVFLQHHLLTARLGTGLETANRIVGLILFTPRIAGFPLSECQRHLDAVEIAAELFERASSVLAVAIGGTQGTGALRDHPSRVIAIRRREARNRVCSPCATVEFVTEFRKLVERVTNRARRRLVKFRQGD